MDEKDEVEEDFRDEVWKVDKDGSKDVDSFNSNSTGVSDRFITDSVVGERTCTMPHKNDLYCSVVPVPLIIDRSFANCPRDAARWSRIISKVLRLYRHS
jgi:hypothetical protein